MKIDLSIVVATLNEEQNVKLLYNLIKASLDTKLKWEVIFVDDDSADDTVIKVNRLIEKNSNIKLIKRLNSRGLSSALIDGALSSNAKYILFMDSDLQHNPKFIFGMYERINRENLDIVSASRFSQNKKIGLVDKRYKISILVNKIINKIFNINMLDSLTGFFIIEKKFFNKSVKNLSNKGFKLLLDIILSNKEYIKNQEITFEFNKRHSGFSKLDNKIIIDFIYLIIDKLIGWIVPARYILYSIVGSLGVIVQIVSFYLIYNQLNLFFSISNIISIFIAMNFNYNLNNIFTYSDLRLRGKKYIKGMFLFYFFCGFGALLNFFTSQIIFSLFSLDFFSVIIGAVIGSIWNYSMNTSFNWKNH